MQEVWPYKGIPFAPQRIPGIYFIFVLYQTHNP